MGGRTLTANSVRSSRGYLITGDYVVSGVDLPAGGGSGTINFNPTFNNTVPANAEVIAAWAFWGNHRASGQYTIYQRASPR